MSHPQYHFSCVIVSAENPEDLNESLNIKNPYGLEEFDIILSSIYLSLMACSIMPIMYVILEMRTSDEKESIKIILDRTKTCKMSREEIRDYLKSKARIKLGI